MELYIQYGHGMKPLALDLVDTWDGGTVILSPRDSNERSIELTSRIVRTRNGYTLIDPQLYNPRANHPKLKSQSYWPTNFDTAEELTSKLSNYRIDKLRSLNAIADTKAFIIPGLLCTMVGPNWMEHQRLYAESADLIVPHRQRWSTIALSANVVRDMNQLEAILLAAENWPVDGYYVTAQTPEREYLVEDIIWLSNILIFLAALRLHGRKVVMGYTSHQMLIAAVANVDAIATGHFLNVRSFSTDRFDLPKDDDRRRAKWWYYCPHALSEFTGAFMDVAHRSGVLGQMAPDPVLDNQFAQVLFSGAQPTSTTWSESLAQRHYIHAVHFQAEHAVKQTYQETFDSQWLQLETAETTLTKLHSEGVRGQTRDFSPMIDVGKSALSQLDSTLGFQLKMEWA